MVLVRGIKLFWCNKEKEKAEKEEGRWQDDKGEKEIFLELKGWKGSVPQTFSGVN